MTTTEMTTPDLFINATEARRRYGLPRTAPGKLAAKGLVRVQRVPGFRPTFSASDLDRVITDSTTTAVAATS